MHCNVKRFLSLTCVDQFLVREFVGRFFVSGGASNVRIVRKFGRICLVRVEVNNERRVVCVGQ